MAVVGVDMMREGKATKGSSVRSSDHEEQKRDMCKCAVSNGTGDRANRRGDSNIRVLSRLMYVRVRRGCGRE